VKLRKKKPPPPAPSGLIVYEKHREAFRKDDPVILPASAVIVATATNEGSESWIISYLVPTGEVIE